MQKEKPIQKKEINEKRILGTISNIILNIKEPFESCSNIELNKLIILTGLNGSGKSFILKLNFAFSIILAGISKYKNKGDILKIMQDTLDHTYSNQNINGQISCVLTTGEKLSIFLEKGKVFDFTCDDFGECKYTQKVLFMSSDMRTFDSISLYLKLRETYASKEKNIEKIIEEMLKHFKLYDIMYIEKLINTCPIKINQQLLNRLQEMLIFDVKDQYIEFNVDLKNSDFYLVNKNGGINYMKNFSKGHQSIINMIIGSST